MESKTDQGRLNETLVMQYSTIAWLFPFKKETD